MGRVSAKVPIRQLSASNDVYDRGFHQGNPGGLDAVDVDLAAGNIADGVTIFGFLGTLAAGALAEDLTSEIQSTLGTWFSGGNTQAELRLTAGTGGAATVVTDTKTFDADSIAYTVAFSHGYSQVATIMKLQLVMGGVQVAESGFVSAAGVDHIVEMLSATRALSGSQVVMLRVHNYDIQTRYYYNLTQGNTNSSPDNITTCFICTGSIKLV